MREKRKRHTLYNGKFKIRLSNLIVLLILYFRTEIINLCSTLSASGLDWRSHAIPALNPIVVDAFCLSITSSEMNASREMLLSMLLGMVSCCSSFRLLVHILKFYRVSDTATWRAASSRVCEAILSNSISSGYVCLYKYEDVKEIRQVKSVLECCSSGVLLQNKQLITDKLLLASEGMFKLVLVDFSWF